jgi:chemotaxis-related protein WspD
VGHCWNCGVLHQAGRALLDREAPDGYGRDLVAPLADAPATDVGVEQAALVFELAGEAYAWPFETVVEVAAWRTVRSVPHRRDDALLGLVNVRGELHLAATLEVLFGLPRPAVASMPATTRLLVVGESRAEWVVPVVSTLGVTLVPSGTALETAPVTLVRSDVPYVRGLFAWRDRRVGLLDDQLVLGALRRRLG